MSNANLIKGDDASNTLLGTAGRDVIYGFDPDDAAHNQASSIAATRVASGLTQPVFVGAPPGDTSRLFIVERTGQIKILDLASGQVLATPFLDVSSEILKDGERGLLGLAFDPDFATNGFFYVNMINLNGDTAIRRYHASPNANVADPASATLIIAIDQPNQDGFTNHKAGWLGFGPDGYLYAALGDGGSAGDPLGSGQNINSLLGKILRLDVSGVPDGLPPDPLHPHYAVPADNPFVNQPGFDEIFAYGLRNPWRDSFDRATGDFYIADVGQNIWEEIDLGEKGVNYGWNTYEGPNPYSGGGPLNNAGPLRFPIHSYDHSVGQSITGGYVYRGEGEALQGQFADGTINVGPVFELNAFGVNAGGWSSDDTYPRELADVDSDGRADIVGFGNAGVWVSLATAGGHFAAPTFELDAFGVNAGGWSSDNTYPRELADVNGDGRADIVGFGNAGVWMSLATAGGHFAAPTFELNAFGVNAGGWSSQDSYPRELADVNGDVRADIVGFGHAGVYVVSEFLVV